MSFVAPWSSGSCSNTGFDMMGAVTLAKWPQTSWLLPSLGFFAVGNSKTGQTHQSCKFVQGQDHVSLDPTTVLIKSGCTCCLSNYCPVLNPRWLRMGYRNTIAIHQRHEHLAFSFFWQLCMSLSFILVPLLPNPHFSSANNIYVQVTYVFNFCYGTLPFVLPQQLFLQWISTVIRGKAVQAFFGFFYVAHHLLAKLKCSQTWARVHFF